MLCYSKTLKNEAWMLSNDEYLEGSYVAALFYLAASILSSKGEKN